MDENKMEYDSAPETYEHIHVVQKELTKVVKDLIDRSLMHDQSKLKYPEKESFDKYTPMLKGLTYGSPEYTKCLNEMKPALDHHYQVNTHHPQYYKDGIKGMNLLDIIEMLIDWKAATLRHDDGDIYRSIEVNQLRFGYSDEFKNLLINTCKYLEF